MITALVTALVTLLAGCGDDPVESEPAQGTVARTESVDALNLVLVTEGLGVARLVGTVINQAEETDRLVGIDVDTEIGEFSVIVARAPLTLPTDEPLELARDAEVSVLAERLRPGFMAELTLVFANSAPIQVQAPVREREGAYSDVEVLRPPDGDIAPDM